MSCEEKVKQCNVFFSSDVRKRLDPTVAVTPKVLFDDCIVPKEIVDGADPETKEAYANSKLIMTKFLQGKCSWSKTRTHEENARLVMDLWHYISNKEICRAILKHETLGDTKLIMVERSYRDSRMGLVAFMIATLLEGPKCRRDSSRESISPTWTLNPWSKLVL